MVEAMVSRLKKKTLLSWSSGKDSAWALHLLRKRTSAFEVVGLFTVVNRKYLRASMHATRLQMLSRQARAANLPLQIVGIPDPCTSRQYDTVVRRFVTRAAACGIECMAFGDIFLRGVRAYREKLLEGTGIRPVFPLWATPTRKLAARMLRSGLRAYISCVDIKKLPASFAGLEWSRRLLLRLPASCDPCGENGEFHTVVTAGPIFSRAVPVRVGRIVARRGFAYADIIPEPGNRN